MCADIRQISLVRYGINYTLDGQSIAIELTALITKQHFYKIVQLCLLSIYHCFENGGVPGLFNSPRHRSEILPVTINPWNNLLIPKKATMSSHIRNYIRVVVRILINGKRSSKTI